MNTILSIIIPVYNDEKHISRCIDSCLKQDLQSNEYEIIIVNDGSKDRTGEIADEYAAKYPTIVKAVHQENQGHGQRCKGAHDRLTSDKIL